MLIDDLQQDALLDAKSVRVQLEQLLASNLFCHSTRYPALLQYIVEQTLEGHGNKLKERLIGIEVFHRAPDYDTNAEPIVRVTAAEVRKRIAQYYHEAEHRDELRIELPTGSYVPRFVAAPSTWAKQTETVDGLAIGEGQSEIPASLPLTITATPAEQNAVASVPVRARRGIRLGLPLLVLLACAVLLVAGLFWAHAHFPMHSDAALEEFWAPLAAGPGQVLIVVGNHSMDKDGNVIPAETAPATENATDDVSLQLNRSSQVTIADLLALLRVTSYANREKIAYRAVGSNIANLDDLRAGPVLLFAGLDNRWTMRLTRQLRFRFKSAPDDAVGIIEDAKDSNRKWIVNFKVPYRTMPEDYAIVARYMDPVLERPVMIAAGVGETGTAVATEFITEEKSLENAAALAPKDWKGHNMEFVLQTSVVDGHPGHAHIVAAEFW